MKRKEVQAVIDANPGKPLYQAFGGFIQIHEQMSKTRALKNAKAYHTVRIQKFKDERPDLYEMYKTRPGGFWNWNVVIVTFDATSKGAA